MPDNYDGGPGYGTGYGSVINVPNPIGATRLTNSYEYIIEIAKQLYVNYPIEDPDMASERAFAYAAIFWERMPQRWKNYLENNRINQSSNNVEGNPTP